MIAALGLTTSCIIATLFTWAEITVTPVTGRITAAFHFSGAVGLMFNPLCLGYLIESVSPLLYVYISIIELLAAFVIFVLTVLIMHRHECA